jgi:hypothetical protein
VDVKVALYVVGFEEPRKGMFRRGLYLARVFPQFRRDILKTE